MNRDKIRQSCWAAVIGFCLAFGSLGCLGTGMGLLSSRELTDLGVWCALVAVAMAAAGLLRFGPWLALAVPLALLWRWFFGPLAASSERLVYELSSIYHSGYGWKILSWTDHPTAGELLSVFRALAAVALLPVTYAMTRRGSAWVALPLTVLPVAATLALVDTVPQAGFLALYLFGAIMLLLSQNVRRHQASQGNTLCLQLALPVAAVLSLIFLLNPQKGYNKQYLAEKLDQTVSAWLEDMGQLQKDLPSDLPGQTDTGTELPGSVQLDEMGPRSSQNRTVMTVTAGTGGRLYLRGGSYSRYTGAQWEIGSQPEYYDQWPSFRANTPVNTLTVTTKGVHNVRYAPYYADTLTDIRQGKLKNDGAKTYSFHYYVMTQDNARNTAGQRVAAGYTDLPVSCRDWAEDTAKAVLGGRINPENAGDVTHAAQVIGRYVLSSAEYSLDTPQMPSAEADFARWFLEESDTGYCVHFATAATVLLRGAGIPARYVSGYAVETRAGKPVEVKSSDAHAWVEYYVPGIGWTVMDPTPGMESGILPQPGTTTPPAATPQDTTPQAATTPGASGSRPDQTTGPDMTGPDITAPQATTLPGDQAAPKKGMDFGWLKYLLWPLAAAAVIIGQWQLRLWLADRAVRSRRGNRRAMLYWRRCERFAKALGETPPEAIRELAQKAKFSQHALSREEFAQLHAYLASSEKRLRKRPWYKQLLYRLVFALY